VISDVPADGLDVVRTFLSAASRTETPGARALFVAKARVSLASTRARLDELETLCAAAEADLTRLAPIGKTGDLPGMSGAAANQGSPGGSGALARKP